MHNSGVNIGTDDIVNLTTVLQLCDNPAMRNTNIYSGYRYPPTKTAIATPAESQPVTRTVAGMVTVMAHLDFPGGCQRGGEGINSGSDLDGSGLRLELEVGGGAGTSTVFYDIFYMGSISLLVCK